jgi:hypothetical protein
MVPDQLFADFTTSWSSLRKNVATGMAKCENYALLAREARAFTLIPRLWEAALHSSPFARAAMSFNIIVGARNSPFLKSKVMPIWPPTRMGR